MSLYLGKFPTAPPPGKIQPYPYECIRQVFMNYQAHDPFKKQNRVSKFIFVIFKFVIYLLYVLWSNSFGNTMIWNANFRKFNTSFYVSCFQIQTYIKYLRWRCINSDVAWLSKSWLFMQAGVFLIYSGRTDIKPFSLVFSHSSQLLTCWSVDRLVDCLLLVFMIWASTEC